MKSLCKLPWDLEACCNNVVLLLCLSFKWFMCVCVCLLFSSPTLFLGHFSAISPCSTVSCFSGTSTWNTLDFSAGEDFLFLFFFDWVIHLIPCCVFLRKLFLLTPVGWPFLSSIPHIISLGSFILSTAPLWFVNRFVFYPKPTWAVLSFHPHISGRGRFPQTNPDLLLHRARLDPPQSSSPSHTFHAFVSFHW